MVFANGQETKRQSEDSSVPKITNEDNVSFFDSTRISSQRISYWRTNMNVALYRGVEAHHTDASRFSHKLKLVLTAW